IVSSFPYLYFTTNGIGAYSGPDTNWWWDHHYLTNGSVVTFLCATANGQPGTLDTSGAIRWLPTTLLARSPGLSLSASARMAGRSALSAPWTRKARSPARRPTSLCP